MLTKIIVNAYSTLIEIALWLMLIAAVLVGWQLGEVTGVIIGLVIAFVLGAIIFGAFLVLVDIRETVRDIANKK